MATLTLKRAKAFNGQARRYEVLLDNQFLTHLKNGETKSLEIPTGSHQLKVRMFPFAQSKDISVELEANTVTSFEIAVSATGGRSYFILLFIFTAVWPVFSRLLIPVVGFLNLGLFLILFIIGSLVWTYYSRYKAGKGLTIQPIEPEP